MKKILRDATRHPEEPLNILTFPTHERYQTNLALTGHNFYLWQKPGVIKPWVKDYGPVPQNTTLLNEGKGDEQLPLNLDIDIVLSQNKFGQFEIASKLAEALNVPLISLEHTLPHTSWDKSQVAMLKEMRGDINVFISEYSRDLWGWKEGEAMIVHHGIDTNLFSPSNVQREERVLSVVNDWINRDWCCGFSLWKLITGYPDTTIPVHVIGDTPGLSKPASSTKQLVEEYRKSKVFMNTSVVSPIPTSLLEAMSCGCAVVSTSNCMIPEIIENGKNGYISNVPLELKMYAELLLNNDEVAEEMGKHARDTILNNFSIEDFVSNWNNIFFSCLEQR
jgi:glycosyltransferase involved in cell wall biosynthesis